MTWKPTAASTQWSGAGGRDIRIHLWLRSVIGEHMRGEMISMGYRIPRDSWAIIERVIRRYPYQKKEYDNTVENLLQGTPENDGQPRGNIPGNPTERIALALNTPRLERIKREIDAVEKIYGQLSEEHKKVVRVRFWSDRSKNMPYVWMQASTSYSERQMRRVITRFIENVGREVGEL